MEPIHISRLRADIWHLKPISRPCYPESIAMPATSRTSAFARVNALAGKRPIHAAFSWLHGNPKKIMDWQVAAVSIEVWGASLDGAAAGADLGGSSKYSSENLED